MIGFNLETNGYKIGYIISLNTQDIFVNYRVAVSIRMKIQVRDEAGSSCRCCRAEILFAILFLVLLALSVTFTDLGHQKSIKKDDSRHSDSFSALKEYDVLTETKKYRHEDKPKIIFFAGLPFSKQKEMNEILNQICDRKCFSLLDVSPIEEQFFFPRLMTNFSEAQIRVKMKLDLVTSTLKKEKIYFVNVYNKKGTIDPELNSTYPDISTNQRRDLSLRHPNILFLEEYFTNLGFDPYFVALFDDLTSISYKYLKYMIEDKSIFNHYQTIAGLKLLDMNLKNLVAQLSLLNPKNRLLLDFSLSRNFGRYDDLLAQANAFENSIGLFGFTNAMKDVFSFEVNPDFTLDEGETNFVEKMELIKQYYSNKFQGKDPKSPFELSKIDVEKIRTVFFAGLEGTGHHLWRDITGRLNEVADLESKPKATCEITELFFTHRMSCFQAFVNRRPLFCSASSDYFGAAYNKIISTLKDKAKVLSSSDVFLLNLAHFNYFVTGHCHTIASYPAFSGRDKNLNKVDLIDFSRIFKSLHEYEFKPIILLRRTADFVFSDVWKRKFHKQKPYLFEEKVLENNAASLLVEQELLGAENIPCLDFNSVATTPDETNFVADVLRVKRKTLVNVVSSVYNKNSTTPEKKLPGRHEKFINTLRRYNYEIYKKCGKVYK